MSVIKLNAIMLDYNMVNVIMLKVILFYGIMLRVMVPASISFSSVHYLWARL